MVVTEKVVDVIVKLMEGWKTRLEVTEDGKVSTSRKIKLNQKRVLARRQLFPGKILSNGSIYFNVDLGD